MSTETKEARFYAHVPFQIEGKDADDAQDGEKRVIAGYASTEDLDRGGDVTHANAFRKTLTTYMQNPLLLYNHTRGAIIGSVLEASIHKGKGLWVRAQIVKDDPLADRVWNLIKQGALRAFSFGFRPTKMREESTDKPSGNPFKPDVIRHIDELELYETSVVDIPMNAFAGFSLAKMLAHGSDANSDLLADVLPSPAPTTPADQNEAPASTVKFTLTEDSCSPEEVSIREMVQRALEDVKVTGSPETDKEEETPTLKSLLDKIRLEADEQALGLTDMIFGDPESAAKAGRVISRVNLDRIRKAKVAVDSLASLLSELLAAANAADDGADDGKALADPDTEVKDEQPAKETEGKKAEVLTDPDETTQTKQGDVEAPEVKVFDLAEVQRSLTNTLQSISTEED